MYRYIISFLVLIMIFGCGSINQSRKSSGISRQQLFTVKDEKTQEILPTLFWSHYDITQRGGIYLVNADGSVRVISENPPDAALNSTIDILAKAKVEDNIDAAAKFTAVKAVAELGQRNAGNYMIRDLAFRIEALKNNHDGKIDSDIISIYKNLITSAEKISISENQFKVYESKANTLKELTSIIKMSKDDTYSDLKLDSTFIKKIGDFIEEE